MKVSDIRPEEAMANQAAALEADIAWLSARKNRFVRVCCPGCGADDAERLYEKYRMEHWRCRNCATQYVNPRPDAALLGEFYATSENYAYWAEHVFPKSRDARREMLFRPRAERVIEIARARGLGNGTLVEVGAAQGLFCDEARKHGTFSRIVAIEPTPDLATECRSLGLETIEAPVERVQLDGTADVVASFEVLEHLFDPSVYLTWCHSLLTPGGFVFLTCPSSAGFETIMLGENSDTVDHEHLNLFTPASLTHLAERCGFVNATVETPGKLDVEIVRDAVIAGRLDRSALGPILGPLLLEGTPETHAALQSLLAGAGLSSHMCLIAERSDVPRR